MIQKNPVGWFEIYVDDMDRAKKFYQAVFQRGEFIKISDDEIKMFAFPWVENGLNSSGALVKTAYMKPGHGGIVIYFTCEDCAIEEQLSSENGGNTIKSKFGIGEYGFVSIIQDTEGNLIGLHSNK
jgi:predicted enzyme related to lactoylglutathione lyase